MAIFGMLQLACGVAYLVLSRELIYLHGADSDLAKALGASRKELISVAVYLIGIPLAFLDSRIAFACYFLVAAMWIIPDRRIERRIKISNPGE